MTSKELGYVLNWMLQNNIITFQQYNEILNKALPYVK